MNTQDIFDEMWGTSETLRRPYSDFKSWYDGEDPKRLRAKQREAEELFRLTGITFNVYGRAEAEERLIPFDLVPRIISGREWQKLGRGIEQRVRAINAFLYDIYHKQEIVRAGRIPEEMISRNDAFLPHMIGVTPPGGIYTHIVGIDLVRTGDDQFYVLEDNARTPSGVSYMLENRETMLRMFPELFSRNSVQPVQNYPADLRRSLAACAPPMTGPKPTVAI
ncbi:MAG: circularly permuted type 2 ATP-grasp protein, partial [Roseovarius indicus]